MRRLLLLAGRELKAYVWSPITWLIFAIAWLSLAVLFRWTIIPTADRSLPA